MSICQRKRNATNTYFYIYIQDNKKFMFNKSAVPGVPNSECSNMCVLIVTLVIFAIRNQEL